MSYFQLEETARVRAVEDILSTQSPEQRSTLQPRVNALINNYEGVDDLLARTLIANVQSGEDLSMLLTIFETQYVSSLSRATSRSSKRRLVRNNISHAHNKKITQSL
ncbi:MAG TPA: hypothetical protein VJK51_02180 [Candidatus Nanoarchaeia archaeon]|nr:hypothetical protein [Candidatus Nanoarchaeia archaeon]